MSPKLNDYQDHETYPGIPLTVFTSIKLLPSIAKASAAQNIFFFF